MNTNIVPINRNEEPIYSNNAIKIFEGHEVEIFNINNEVLFNPYHVGACLDIAESTVREHVSAMNKNQVIKVTNKMLSDAGLTDIRKLNNAGENFLKLAGLNKLLFKSRKMITDVVYILGQHIIL